MARPQLCASVVAHSLVIALLLKELAAFQADLSPKRGTGWGYSDSRVAPELAALPLAWWYNWGNSDPDIAAAKYSQDAGVEFVPMIYGDCCGINEPDSLPEDAIALLGFNEPNHLEESNLTPQAAAALWPKLQAMADDYSLLLGSPAAAPCGARCVVGSPFEWWDQFFDNCTDCRVDFITTHYYTCSAQYLQWYLNDVQSRYGLPVWLTEWACPNENGTLSRQIRYMRNALKVLDDNDGVDRYAWFAPHTDDFAWIGPTASLFEPGSTPPKLSTLGKVYASSDNATMVNSTSAIVEDQLAISSAALSAVEVQALTEPLSAVEKTGSWLAECEDCLTNSLSAFALTQHCQDCGLPPRSALDAPKLRS